MKLFKKIAVLIWSGMCILSHAEFCVGQNTPGKCEKLILQTGLLAYHPDKPDSVIPGDIPLHFDSILHRLAKESGLNWALHPELTTLTIPDESSLNAEPWKEVLHYLIQQRKLEVEVEGNIVRGASFGYHMYHHVLPVGEHRIVLPPVFISVEVVTPFDIAVAI